MAPVALRDFGLSHVVPVWAAVAVNDPLTPPAFRGDVHAGLEVGIVLRGAEERMASDHAEPMRVGAGQTWCASMWEPHFGRIAEAGTQTVDIIFLPEFLGDELLGDLPWLRLFTAPPAERPRICEEEARAAVAEVGHRLGREIRARLPGWQTAVKAGLLQVLVLLRRAWTECPASQDHHRGELARLLPVVAQLRHDPGGRLSRAEAGQMCGLSGSRFSVVFRRTMGVSFQQFTRQTRLGQAAHLLLFTPLSVEDVASRLGFVDGSHLHRHFTKLYGCTPAAYRRRFGA